MKKKSAKLDKILTPEELLRLELKKEMFFEPCQTKEELREFLNIFLKLDFPDFRLDEMSTSTPMDFVWEVYQTMKDNTGPFRHIAAASRGSAKTLVAATIEFLAMIHFRRDVVHTSALKAQSKKALKYFKKFCNVDVLKQYFTAESAYEFELMNLPITAFTEKDDSRLVTVAATIAGVNGERSNILVLDETDLVDREVISEAAMMQTPTLCGRMHEPVSIFLSSRKTNDGPVQDLIDEAESGSTKIKLHKYSTVDWMKKCPDSIHGAGGVKAWIHKDTLKLVWDNLPETEPASSYIERSVYEGCRTCPVMTVCQGRSAKQQSTSKFLKSRESVELLLADTKDTGKIIAQILNWKPESTGTVFSSFSRFTHCMTPANTWEFITGQKWLNPENPPSKEDLYRAGKAAGYDCVYGVDFGYSPDPAVVVVVLYHRKTEKTAIIHVRSANYYSNSDWAASVGSIEAKLYPPDLICPDMADPAAHTYFAKLRLPSRNKKPMRIETGVSQVRSLLFDPMSQTSKFCIAMFDDQSEWTAQSFLKWRHKTSVVGTVDPHGFEDSEWTHTLDALRYSLDPFIKAVKTSFSAKQAPQESKLNAPLPSKAPQAGTIEEYKKLYQQHLQKEMGIQNISLDTQVPSATLLNQDFLEQAQKAQKSGQSGKFSFKF